MEEHFVPDFVWRPRNNRSYLLQVLKFASLPGVQVPVHAMLYESGWRDSPDLFVRYFGRPGAERPRESAPRFDARPREKRDPVPYASYDALAEELLRLPDRLFTRVRLRGMWEISPTRGAMRGEELSERARFIMDRLIPRYTALASATRAGLVDTLNELFRPGDFQSLAEYVLDHMQRRLYKCNVWVEREDGDDVLEPRPEQCREAWLAAVCASRGTAYGLMDAFELPFVRAVVGERMSVVVERIAALSGIEWAAYEPLMFSVGGEAYSPRLPEQYLVVPDVRHTDWRED